MPTYTFRNTVTQDTETLILSLSQREEYLSENPHIVQELATPRTGDSVLLGVRKIDNSFNDVLLKAKGAHLGSNIETK